MEQVFHILGPISLTLVLFSFLAFILGLIKPQLVKMPNRKKATIFYLGVCSVMIILTIIFISDVKNNPQNETVTVSQPKAPEFEYLQMSLKEYRDEAQVTRQDIVKNYLESALLDDSHFDIFYNCLSQMSYTKKADLKLGEVLGWCKTDFDRSPDSLNDRINLDNFMSKFSFFDGSYQPLEKQIRNDMNDRKSYSHENTSYWLHLNEKPPVATVLTTFTGKNLYNATVKQQAVATVDIITGDIISIKYE